MVRQAFGQSASLSRVEGFGLTVTRMANDSNTPACENCARWSVWLQRQRDALVKTRKTHTSTHTHTRSRTKSNSAFSHFSVYCVARSLLCAKDRLLAQSSFALSLPPPVSLSSPHFQLLLSSSSSSSSRTLRSRCSTPFDTTCRPETLVTSCFTAELLEQLQATSAPHRLGLHSVSSNSAPPKRLGDPL